MISCYYVKVKSIFYSKMLLPFYWLYPFILQNLIWVPTRLIFSFFLRLEIKGAENFTNLPAGIIFANNHSSELDPFFVPACLPFLSRLSPVFYTSREKAFYQNSGWRQFFYGGLFFKLWGAYSVLVGLHNFEKSLAVHIRILENGGSVNIFPEGKKTRDGNLGEAKGGVAYLAVMTGKPIIPVFVSGVLKITCWDFLLRRRKVTVSFGKPILAGEIQRITRKGIYADGVFEKAAALVMQKISALKEEILDASFGIIPIWNDNTSRRFLLVRSKNTQEWAFPKGHKNDGETDEQAALRELAEETGLRDVSIIPNLSFTDSYNFQRAGAKIHKTVTFFSATANNSVVVIDKTEIDDFRWATYKEALATLSFEEPKRILEKLRSCLEQNYRG